VAHFHVKKKNGRPYLYVREIARVNGKPKVVSQVYVGSPERVVKMAKGLLEAKPSRLKVEEFGALWAANEMDRDVDLAGIIDDVVPPDSRDKPPSIGEFFLYCVLNRMVQARSKSRLAEWYSRTAIQQIRPVMIAELNSQRYWEKWDRVSEEKLDTIARRFLQRVWEQESPDAECLLFDTTNYYTFMASHTDSELAKRGHNKAGRHNLRQVGLGLLVGRESRLPLHYKVYAGNQHDSKLFHAMMDDMFGVMCGLQSQGKLTIVIDKGMNADGNYAVIDDHEQIHFVTTYSTYFAEELATTPLDRFEDLDLERNQRLDEQGKSRDRIVAFRSLGEYWGRQRAVVVTHNPATARKQIYTLDSKLATLRTELLEMRAKVREHRPHWRKPETIRERYFRLCEQLHISADFYDLDFERAGGKLSMSFRKNQYRVEQKKDGFGRNIIITDNVDWSIEDIVQASLDRWQVEDRFRQSKNDELVSGRPIRHWTDSKIRCHLFTCVVALTYLRRLELRLQEHGIKATADSVMEELRHLHSVLSIEQDGRSKPRRRIEEPSPEQEEFLAALGHCVDAQGVLQTHGA